MSEKLEKWNTKLDDMDSIVKQLRELTESLEKTPQEKMRELSKEISKKEKILQQLSVQISKNEIILQDTLKDGRWDYVNLQELIDY